MSQGKRKSGLFVAPGDRLGVIEEFTPGAGTYVENGIIHSKITGRTLLDMLNKEVSVFPLVQAVRVPRPGSIVSGQVLNVKGKTAVLRILQVGKRPLSGFFTGVLYISDVSPRYVENMFSACKRGDIMRAKVISDKNRTFYLSTAEENLGVIYAFCSRCGHVLLSKKHEMQCPRCGNVENRKVTPDYGKGAV